MSVTMRDVAQKAGVSIKTVSRVVNNQGEIAEATRQRVLAVIKELGYHPNRVAQAMITQRTHTIGFVIPDITNPFFPEVAQGIQDLARERDYNVFMCNAAGSPEENVYALHSLAAQGVDGIILWTSSISHENLIAFADGYRPIAVVNRHLEHPSISQIIVDNYQGAMLAVDHLVGLGHTKIAMLAGYKDTPSKGRRGRVRGFYDALQEHGLTVVPDWIVPGSPRLARGYEATFQLLSQAPQISAIFAYNDLLAMGAIRACHDLGRRVPDDCAIVGFDDIRFAEMITPRLTTVHYDKYALGRQTAKRLLEMVENPDTHFPTIYVGVKLVVRESA